MRIQENLSFQISKESVQNLSWSKSVSASNNKILDQGLMEKINSSSVSVKLSKLGLASAEELKNLPELEKFEDAFESKYETKFGYAYEFDSVSRTYMETVVSKHDYKAASEMNIVSRMEEKYYSIRQSIEESFSGEELTERLAELDKDYKQVLNRNVLDPTKFMLNNEKAINKIRQSMYNAYYKAYQTKSRQYAQAAYGNIEHWGKISEKMESQLKGFLEKLAQLREQMNSAKENDFGSYADSVLKQIYSGVHGTREAFEKN